MTTKNNFNWIAPVYDALAYVVFGNRLQQAQTIFLDQIPSEATILIVGGGSGKLLVEVIRQCRPHRVLYLETSARMAALTIRRLIRTKVMGSVEIRVGDETTLVPTEQFDVILTPFLLDLFTESSLQNRLIPRLDSALKPDGRWLVTDFIETDRLWQRALLWSMIRFFRLTAGIETTNLVDWQQLLAQAGFVRQQHKLRVGGMVSTEVWRKD